MRQLGAYLRFTCREKGIWRFGDVCSSASLVQTPQVAFQWIRLLLVHHANTCGTRTRPCKLYGLRLQALSLCMGLGQEHERGSLCQDVRRRDSLSSCSLHSSIWPWPRKRVADCEMCPRTGPGSLKFRGCGHRAKKRCTERVAPACKEELCKDRGHQEHCGQACRILG